MNQTPGKQLLKNKQGEVEFRRKLALQFAGKESYYPGEPSDEQYLQIVRGRIKDYTMYFKELRKKNLLFSPYLELGAGVGQGAMLLENKFGLHGFTTDISLETLELSDQYLDQLAFKKMPIRICCDTYNLPFVPKSIPFIFCFQTLHHLPDPQPLMKEVKRVLAPGGVFYLGEEPIGQTFNLNLWRRDRNLKWFEKILKALVVLHFISRIGRSEVDNNILEEAFLLPTWEKALNEFDQVEVVLKAFPFGPTVRRSKNKQSFSANERSFFSNESLRASSSNNNVGWINPPLIQRLIFQVLGGGIDAFCQINGQLTNQKRLQNIFQLLACPNCDKKPPLKLDKPNMVLSCKQCRSVYKSRNGIFILISKSLLKRLYPKL